MRAEAKRQEIKGREHNGVNFRYRLSNYALKFVRALRGIINASVAKDEGGHVVGRRDC